jgi:hypothetical protein
MSQAPKGKSKIYTSVMRGREVSRELITPEIILCAGNEGVVTPSYWIEKQERWSMFTKSTPPLAWMPFPKHPLEEEN